MSAMSMDVRNQAGIERKKLDANFKQVLEEVPTDNHETVKQILNNVELCLSSIHEQGSFRHLHYLLPRALTDLKHHGVELSMDEKFLQAMQSPPE